MDEIILTEADLVEIPAQAARWGEDGELIEAWFAEGEQLAHEDWVYWLDLYDEQPNRSDLLVHWLRCLVDPTLPRPTLQRTIEGEPAPAPRRLELALSAR